MTDRRLLYLICCGAGPAERVAEGVTQAQEVGWDIQIVATPAALGFFDTATAEAMTDRPVRSQYRSPGQPRSDPADAILMAPATLNTICKLAAGISDTYALGILNEAIGLNLPIAVLPFLNQALAARAPYRTAIRQLREEGVHILDGPDGCQPHPPHTGGALLDTFPWHHGLDNLADRINP